MAIIVWPTSLPYFVNLQGHRQTAGDGRLRSSTDVGPGKVRRRSSASVKPVSAVVRLNTVQKAISERFWDEDTAEGTLPFLFPAIGRYGFPLRSINGGRLLTTDGGVIRQRAWWRVRFSAQAEPPSWDPVSAIEWDFTFQLEILP